MKIKPMLVLEVIQKKPNVGDISPHISKTL